MLVAGALSLLVRAWKCAPLLKMWVYLILPERVGSLAGLEMEEVEGSSDWATWAG